MFTLHQIDLSLLTGRNVEPRDELGLKFAAQCLLNPLNTKLIIPTHSEWIGVNLLIRDDELSQPRGPKDESQEEESQEEKEDDGEGLSAALRFKVLHSYGARIMSSPSAFGSGGS